ncbi:MAG: cation diffusion facilitator family transporter [Planctomycetota bacterium]|jgi:cation diffusion facilitator family transporter
MRSNDHLYHEASRAAWLGLVVNAGLGVIKLLAGLAGHSFALIADAVNSLGDMFTSAVVILALRIARKPPDAEHPYGHTRAEAIVGSNVALLVAVSAIVVAWEAMQRIDMEHPVPPVWTLWIAGANVLIKEALYRYKVAVGRRTGSIALIANAWDHRSDALCSLAVLVGMAVVRWGGESVIWADEAAALVVVGAILWSATLLYRRSAHELMDAQADDELLRGVEAVALAVPEVHRVETLRLRKSGLEYFADMHIEVDPDLTVSEGHAIGHRVKDRVLERFENIRDVLVHLEPRSQ